MMIITQTIDDYNPNNEDYFKIDGRASVFYNKDIDTLEKMRVYLNDVFSEGKTSLLTRDKSEMDGRLYHTDADMGTVKRWNESMYILVDEALDDEEIVRTYLFKIPGPDESYYFQLVEIVYEEEWKVDTILIY